MWCLSSNSLKMPVYSICWFHTSTHVIHLTQRISLQSFNSNLEIKMSDFLSLYIVPLFSTIGIFGNIFMLWILFRWIFQFHIGCNLCRRKHKHHMKFKPSNSVLNYAMCIYLTFLSLADLGYLFIVLSTSWYFSGNTVWIDISNAFKGMFYWTTTPSWHV